jgi:hypothetical protein
LRSAIPPLLPDVRLPTPAPGPLVRSFTTPALPGDQTPKNGGRLDEGCEARKGLVRNTRILEEPEMKPVALILAALMILSTSAFAADKQSAIAPEPNINSLVSRAPDLSGVPESLWGCTLWAYFLTNVVSGELDVSDLARGTHFVERAMEKQSRSGKK